MEPILWLFLTWVIRAGFNFLPLESIGAKGTM